MEVAGERAEDRGTLEVNTLDSFKQNFRIIYDAIRQCAFWGAHRAGGNHRIWEPFTRCPAPPPGRAGGL